MNERLRRALYAICKAHCYREEGQGDANAVDYLEDYLSSGNVWGEHERDDPPFTGLSETELEQLMDWKQLLTEARQQGNGHVLDENSLWECF